MSVEKRGEESKRRKSDSINLDFSIILGLLKQKKVQTIITILLFTTILFGSTWMRLHGIPNLVDQTSGKYLSADPDAFYEYRVAETILDQGDISGVDPKRSPGLNLPYTQEMQPKIVALAYKILIKFNEKIILDFVHAMYPIFAFSIGLILFFCLCLYLSESKILALLASLMLAYSPTYLQRTGAGISSHEALGMVFFFFGLLVYSFSINNYKKNLRGSIGLGILTG